MVGSIVAVALPPWASPAVTVKSLQPTLPALPGKLELAAPSPVSPGSVAVPERAKGLPLRSKSTNSCPEIAPVLGPAYALSPEITGATAIAVAMAAAAISA